MTTQPTPIDWKRVYSYARKEARNLSLTPGLVEDLETILPNLADLCGPASNTRRAMQKIARSYLYSNGKPVILVPCCPDYSHQDGVYTFKGLSGGVSLLTCLHAKFLRHVTQVMPGAAVRILLADQEAEDEELCKSCRVTKHEFINFVHQSLSTTSSEVAHLGWSTRLFTQEISSLHAREGVVSRELLVGEKTKYRISLDTAQRREMYKKIRGSMTWQEMLQRTARTSAQYLVLGHHASEHGYLICNHTTTNLSWYGETEAGILHNPISVY